MCGFGGGSLGDVWSRLSSPRSGFCLGPPSVVGSYDSAGFPSRALDGCFLAVRRSVAFGDWHAFGRLTADVLCHHFVDDDSAVVRF